MFQRQNRAIIAHKPPARQTPAYATSVQWASSESERPDLCGPGVRRHESVRVGSDQCLSLPASRWARAASTESNSTTRKELMRPRSDRTARTSTA